ncbi:SAM-dependent methyltransferase [Actinomadura rubrisoli]|uniref:SAM-dependent methyltransferase n=1 Tax=Actinomadura rubrisoli TaxID=2530368 RepID=A0A4R5AZP6_9ACTN|nr:SAM-dependent methyltransferase [Actinomadura rubrisoli]
MSEIDGTAGIDTTVPHSARIWNYWLGGKDNYQADREAGDRIAAMIPEIVANARADRAFLARAVRYVIGRGIAQFLDIGTGLPTADNTHEVAQRLAPASRIVYVDNDPLVLAHARALLTSSAEGVTDYIQADVGDPAGILTQAARTLDLDRPVAIMLLGIMWHITDDGEAAAIVRRLMDAVPTGSCLVLADMTIEATGERMAAAIEEWNRHGRPPGTWRVPDRIRELFFGGLEVVEPGIVSCTRWRPDPATGEPAPDVDRYCGVGLKL